MYVCFCSQFNISSLISKPPQHTHISAMRASAFGGANKEKCNIQCICIILYRCGHRENVEMFGACNSYDHQNQQDSKNKPTLNWEHPPSLFGAAQNLSASRNIPFAYFQVCIIGMASSQKGKMCPVSCCRQTESVFFMDSELLSCRKLLKIDVGKYVIPELGQLCKQAFFMKSILKVKMRMN